MSQRAWTVVAGGVSVLVAVASTWPLATVLPSAVPTLRPDCLGQGCEDEFLCVWIVTSLARNLLRAPWALFEGDFLLPLRHTLAYSETMLTAVALSAPVTWLTGNHVLAYNLHYLATSALSVFGTYLLLRDVTGDPRAAIVGGLLFGLANERWAAHGHLAKVSVQWVPFVCWTWLRLLDRPGRGRAIAAMAAMLANLHAGVYQGLLLPLPLCAWAGVLASTRRWPVRRWVSSVLVLALATAAGLALYYPFAVVRDEMSVTTSGIMEMPGGWSWYFNLCMHPLAYVARLGAPQRWSNGMTPLPVAVLLVAGITCLVRAPREAPPPSVRGHILAILAFMVVSAGLTVAPDRLGPLRPIAAAVFALPGLDGLRGRDRIAIFVTFGAAVLLGLALASILRRVRRGAASTLITLVAAAAVVLDTSTLFAPTPVTRLPSAQELPAALQLAIRQDTHGGLLHLPYRWPFEAQYMMWALAHERPIMNGHTAFFLRFNALVNQFPSAETRDVLLDAGVTQVLVHTAAMDSPADVAMLERIRGATDLKKVVVDDAILVTLERSGRPIPRLDGQALPRAGWRVDGSDPDAALAADGDIRTHWTAGTIGRPTYLRVDLGAEHVVTGLRLELAQHLREYPHAWELWGSTDGASWTRLGEAHPTRPPFDSYRRNHRAIVLDLPIEPAAARVIELRVPPQPPVSIFGSHGNGTWGVHELAIFATGPSSEAK